MELVSDLSWELLGLEQELLRYDLQVEQRAEVFLQVSLQRLVNVL